MKKILSLLLLWFLSLLLNACIETNPTIDSTASPENKRSTIIRPPKPKPTHPEQRVALIIGNGAYLNKLDRLKNPTVDADDMATVLKKVGFKVTVIKDASQQKMERAIQAFGKQLKKGGVGLFYFAGHGMQSDGKNYLFPIGAMKSVTLPEHLKYKTVEMGYILATMEGAGNALNIVFLDACRNNPFARSLLVSRGKEAKQGLASIDEAPSGTLIAYATKANNVALDSIGGRNSPYVKHLKRELLKPGISILDMLTNVRMAVRKETKKKQAPAFYAELDRQFCFVGPCGGVQQPKPTPQAVAVVPPKPKLIKVFRDTLKDGSKGPEMVRIPAGSFRMGDIQGGGESDEKPVHRVSLSAFSIGKFEVTVDEFQQFVKATRYKTDAEKEGDCYVYQNNSGWNPQKGANWRNPSFSQNNTHPVTCVSWNDATAYAAWLSQQTSKKYRLPTEAEWEYAARAGTETKYWWGNEIGSNKANCSSGCGDSFLYTAPVGSFEANPFHIYDTVGNVWEWLSDIYQKDYYSSFPRSNSIGLGWGGTGRYRVRRGGAWLINAPGARAANRGNGIPGYRTYDLGFRLWRQPS